MNQIPTDIITNPSDQAIRLKAIDPAMSFAVSAPAGSGKTGLLTQRVLQLLSCCEQPEEILAITFTRKAAGEMQDRIIKALWQAAEAPQPEDPHTKRTWNLAQAVLKRDAESGWNLLENPQRLRITTIDSLCRSITQQLPLASGIGAQPDTLDNPDLAYRMAVRELFGMLDEDTPLREHLARLLRHLDNDLQKIEDLLSSLLATREQWLGSLLLARHQNARQYFESVLDSVIREHLQLVSKALQAHASELCMIADQAAQNLIANGDTSNNISQLCGIIELPSCSPDAIPAWRAIADLLLTSDANAKFRKAINKNQGFPAGKEGAELKKRFVDLTLALIDTAPDVEELLSDIRYLPQAHYADGQWQLLESLTYILPQLVAELMLVFKQLAATDYSAISQAALLALGDEDQPSDLALKLDYRIRHILVDEFQDTSSPQLELLKKLTQGWQTGDGRTLFIVGDGMQSCYGFRNANVGLFLDARQQGIGAVELEAVDLNVNFRSHRSIVEWVNRLFTQAFPAENDISRSAVRYSPSIAFKPHQELSGVQIHLASYDKASTEGEEDEDNILQEKTHARQQEAAKIIELVRDAQQQNPEATIAILVRTRNHLDFILPALNQAGLDYQATDIERLSSRMAIMDVHSLTRALCDLSDRIAWLSLLRAPWCGLSLADLHALATTDLGEYSPRIKGELPVFWQQLRYFPQIATLSSDGKQRLGRIVPLLENTLNEAYRKPLSQWIEGTWLALGGPACLLAAEDIDNIHTYFKLLDKQSEAGRITDWNKFNQALEQLFASPQSNADSRLQVMTIHKSKGLEFDTVIIPALDRSNRSDDKGLLLWQERLNHTGESQLLLGSFEPVGKQKDLLYDFMNREKNKRQQLEATRLLYVGCTRAIRQLHLLACVQKSGDDLKAPGKNSLLNSIWKWVKEEGQLINIQNIGQPNATSETQPYARLVQDWQIPAFTPENLLAAHRGHGHTNTNDNPLNLPELETRHNRLARHTGTLIHSALETMVIQQWIAQNRSAEEYIQQHQYQWQQQLRHRGWSADEIQWAHQKIIHAITGILQHEQGRWILDHRHQNSACELALIQKDRQGIRELVIDRTFIIGDTRWIIDYKSSEPAPGETIENFLKNEAEIYRAQLAGYHQVMAPLTPHRISTALYFVVPGIFYVFDE